MGNRSRGGGLLDADGARTRTVVGAAVDFAIELAQQVAQHAFHLHNHAFDLAVEVAPANEGDDGHEQAEESAVQSLADANAHHVRAAVGRHLTDGDEEFLQAADGAEQAKEGRNADDHLQGDQSVFEFHRFAAGARLDSVDVLGMWPVEMVEGDADDGSEGGGVVVSEHGETVGVFAGPELLNRGGEGGANDVLAAQGHAAFNDDGQGDNRRDAQRHHDGAAFAEK